MSGQLGLDLGYAGPVLRPHPATYPKRVLEVLRRLVPKGLVLDPFGGVGKIGRIGPEWTTVSSELEPEWASQGPRNHCALSVIANAMSLPFSTGAIPAIGTSPAYATRMADKYAGGSKRSDETRGTYRISLGRDLSAGSGASLQWGEEYRELHRVVWVECRRVLRPGGVLVLNCKDHIRGGERQYVCAWHRLYLESIGFKGIELVKVPLRGDANMVRMRAKGLATVDYEEVSAWRKESGRSWTWTTV